MHNEHKIFISSTDYCKDFDLFFKKNSLSSYLIFYKPAKVYLWKKKIILKIFFFSLQIVYDLNVKNVPTLSCVKITSTQLKNQS